MGGLFFDDDFDEVDLSASDGDVGEVGFLILHPFLGCEWRGHPEVASEEVDGWPFKAFGLVDGREGESGRGGGVIVGEEGFDLGVEVFEGADGGEVDDGSDTGDFVLKDFKGVRRELGLLLAEMGGEPLEEFGFGDRFGFFTKRDELFSHIAAFDSALGAIAKELKGEGDERGVLPAEDSFAGKGGTGRERKSPSGFLYLRHGTFNRAGFWMDMGDELSGV